MYRIFYQVHRVQDRLTTGLGGLKPIWILVPSGSDRYKRGIGFRAVTDWYQSIGPHKYGVSSILLKD